MKPSLKVGLSFGLTSGIITTLGLITGLNAGTHSKLVVIGGILTIAIADAFSDALGIHVSQESQLNRCDKPVWESTIATFLAKFFFALTFIVPILFFELSRAVLIDVAWGILLMIIFNYYLARQERKDPWKVITEHLFICLLVILITRFAGNWIAKIFK
jgi:VIT1/CCC1 family predicted Fe2+/Mn2+ transporter